MARVVVNSLEQAFIVMRRAFRRLDDWEPFFDDYFEPYLEQDQDEHWNEAFNVGLAPATVQARRNRWGYYEFEPNTADGSRQSRPGGPSYLWTGEARASTKALTESGRREAHVETSENYVGPIDHPDPVELFLERLGLEDAWNEDALDWAVDNVLIEQWLEEEIIPTL